MYWARTEQARQWKLCDSESLREKYVGMGNGSRVDCCTISASAALIPIYTLHSTMRRNCHKCCSASTLPLGERDLERKLVMLRYRKPSNAKNGFNRVRPQAVVFLESNPQQRAFSCLTCTESLTGPACQPLTERSFALELKQPRHKFGTCLSAKILVEALLCGAVSNTSMFLDHSGA